MRQVKGLLVVIGKADLVEFYHQLLSYGTIHQVKLPTLEEFLALTSDKAVKGPQGFDEATDKFLEAEALKRLHERQSRNGQ